MKLIGTGASWASAPYQRIACMVLYCMELSATAGWLPDCLLFYVFFVDVFAISSHAKIHLLFLILITTCCCCLPAAAGR